jgi:glucose/arabinose dehydrogenase
LALVLVVVLVPLWTPTPASGLTLPPSFQLVDYPTGQAPYNLTDFEWLPDGGLLTSGKDGTVTYVPPGGDPRVLAKVPSVRALGDHGMLGFALANDYGTSGRIYVTYDKGAAESTGFGVVEEWVASPPLRPSTFVRSRTVLDGETRSPQLAQVKHTHGIDAVVVAPDDSLFVSVGDDALNNGDPQTLRAQDLDQPYGKLLHLTPAGSGVPSNPFYSPANPASWRSMVYAYGLRNPFRFSLDPRSGMPIVGDVGWLTHEEINTLPPGANGGWPCFEGMFATTFSPASVCKALSSARSARMPIWAYPHAGSGAAVVGGMHYTGSSYPAQYQGAYFFGDYTRKQLWTLRTDATGKLTRAPETNGFASYAGAPVAFHPGPNGDVTYADLLRGYVRRLVYTTGNRAPTAQFATTTNAANRTVSLSATDSYDLDGDELTFQWEFGDGTSAAGETATHTYGGTKDAFDVTLTVKDQLGAVGRSTVKVYPDNRTPTLTLDEPAPSKTYSVNDTVQLSASATDPEDGALTVEWDTALLHCPFAGSCHRHPESAETGPSYSAPFTDHGADTTMLVTARAVDSKGATITASYEARPRVRTLAINSPVAVSVNGELRASAEVVAGSEVQVSAPTSTGYWRFQSWSDAGAAVHSFTMPDADRTLAARYETAIEAKYTALGAGSSYLGTPTSLEYEVAGGRARNYTGGRLFWSTATGAHAARGAVLAKYLAGGGPAAFGFPTHDEVTPTPGQASYFAKARIYWSPATGAHFVRGPILAKYLAAGGPGKYGLPTRDVTTVTGGSYAHFAGDRSIFWSSARGAHLVRGPIRARYAAKGWQRGCLGFPSTDQLRVKGGVRNLFAGGQITYVYKSRSTTARC